MLFFNAFWDIFSTMFVIIFIVVILVFVLIVFFVYKIMNSNVNTRRSSSVKVETVNSKVSAEPSIVPEKKKEVPIQYCLYCGEKISPQEKICQSCGAEI